MCGRNQATSAVPDTGPSPVIPLSSDDPLTHRVGRAVHSRFLSECDSPTVEDLQHALNLNDESVRSALLALHLARRLVVHMHILRKWEKSILPQDRLETPYVVQAMPPFCSVNVGVVVQSGLREYNTTGALGAFALPHILRSYSTISTRCPGCSRDIAVPVNVDRLPFPDRGLIPVAHLSSSSESYVSAVAAHRLLCSIACLRPWLYQQRAPRGVILDTNDLWRLGKLLARCCSAEERAVALRLFGLIGKFWETMPWYAAPKPCGGPRSPVRTFTDSRIAVKKHMDWVTAHELGGHRLGELARSQEGRRGNTL